MTMRGHFIYMMYFILFIFLTALPAQHCYAEKGSPDSRNTDEELERLISLPYLDFSPRKADQTKSGVTFSDPSKTYEGYNLYFRMQGSEAYLMDMNGDKVHQWNFPDTKKQMWRAVELMDDGSLIVVDIDNGLKRFDWDSKIIYENLKIAPHHDIEVLPDGSMLLLVRDFHKYRGRNVAFDSILRITPENKVISRWSTFENFEELQKLHKPSILDTEEKIKKTTIDKYRKYMQKVFKRKKVTFLDYYHANTIESLPDTPLGRKDSRFRKGNWLISLRNVDMIAIIDSESGKIVWSWGPGEISVQHNPSMLENGNILIFDNQGNSGYSRVIEIDPVKKEIVWDYKGDPPEDFFSMWRGAAQRLPNGNTLITDSVIGRALEVSQDREIVWEWMNPDISIKKKQRMSVYRVKRVNLKRLAMEKK